MAREIDMDYWLDSLDFYPEVRKFMKHILHWPYSAIDVRQYHDAARDHDIKYEMADEILSELCSRRCLRNGPPWSIDRRRLSRILREQQD